MLRAVSEPSIGRLASRAGRIREHAYESFSASGCNGSEAATNFLSYADERAPRESAAQRAILATCWTSGEIPIRSFATQLKGSRRCSPG
jgi:hypothetical protein